MIVQFPEANAQYEYLHESKKFMKVVTPRDNEPYNQSDGEDADLQGPYGLQNQHDCTLEEVTDGINRRPAALKNSEKIYEKKSPGSKMRQSHAQASMFVNSNASISNASKD